MPVRLRRPVPTLLAAAVAALLAAAASPQPAQACGEGRQAAARDAGSAVRRPPLVLGDSTMIFATPALGRLGLEADAHGCRQFSAGVAMLRARRHAGTLPRLAILALGANGAIGRSEMREALRVVGPRRVLGVVTPVNSAASRYEMYRAARLHPDRVLLIDWLAYSRGRGGWFAGDGLHVTYAGADAFARLIARRAQPLMPPPVASLRIPRTADGAEACGDVERFGTRLAVHVIRGADRVSCERARALARRPPLSGARGWRYYDWRGVSRGGPWAGIYAGRRGLTVVGVTAAQPAPPGAAA